MQTILLQELGENQQTCNSWSDCLINFLVFLFDQIDCLPNLFVSVFALLINCLDVLFVFVVVAKLHHLGEIEML